MIRLKHLSPFLLLTSLLFALATSIATVARADEMVIPVGQQGTDKASLEKPKTGMKAEAVEKKFGAPLKKSAAVGKPPISSWEYPQFHVYFESDRVINTVLKPYSDAAAVAPAPEATPTPVVAAPAVAPTAVEQAAPEAAPAIPAAAASTPDVAPAPEAAPVTTETGDKTDAEDEKPADEAK